MTVSILGCGWYGRALASGLLAKGITVKGSVTSDDKLSYLKALGIQPFAINFPAGDKPNATDFFDCDALVISIPPKFRKGEGTEFIPKIKSVISAITKHANRNLIYISSTGVYGDDQGTVTEWDEPVPGNEPGRLLLQAEGLFQNQEQFQAAILRFGGLVGPGRHPGRFFAGKKDIPNGLAPVNLIHLKDAVGTGLAIIERHAYGYIFNACSPGHLSKSDFYVDAALKAGLPPPKFIQEANSIKTVNSVNLHTVLNYNFSVSNWADTNY